MVSITGIAMALQAVNRDTCADYETASRLSAFISSTINWCLSHWRGSALGFPRGEAVAKIGSSEPILVTDEEWRNLPITGAVRNKAPYWNTVCPLVRICSCTCRRSSSTASRSPFPPGEGICSVPQAFKHQLSHQWNFFNSYPFLNSAPYPLTSPGRLDKMAEILPS